MERAADGMGATGSRNFTARFAVDQSPEAVFAAINDVRGWWSVNIEGATDRLGEFVFHNEPIHMSRMRITELVPGKRVVWCVIETEMSFVRDKTEWVGNVIVFDIAQKDGRTEMTFTQHGLVPDYECYELCSNAWGGFLPGSLKQLIETGKGEPIVVAS